MELFLRRAYFKTGTIGDLYANGVYVCHTLEPPWLGNAARISCIPEGRFTVTKRYSDTFKHHLLVEGVPDRSLILFHPANHVHQLQGCIAPVDKLKGPMSGLYSRLAFERLMGMVHPAFVKGEGVSLVIG